MHCKSQHEEQAHGNKLLVINLPENEDELTDTLSSFCDQLLKGRKLDIELSLALIDMGFVIAFENQNVTDFEKIKFKVEENIRVMRDLVSYRT